MCDDKLFRVAELIRRFLGESYEELPEDKRVLFKTELLNIFR